MYNSITQELDEQETVAVPATLVDTKKQVFCCQYVSVKHPVQSAPSQKNRKRCACVYKCKWLFHIYKCNHNYMLVLRFHNSVILWSIKVIDIITYLNMLIYVIVLWEYADYTVSNLKEKQCMHFFLHDNDMILLSP